MTRLLYLDNMEISNHSAKIVEIGKMDEVTFLILDQTIFYPQGGGQPSDTGKIIGNRGQFEVSKCVFLNGEVYHFGNFIQGNLNANDEVVLQLDYKNRKLHSRIHSAGHFIDLAIFDLGLDWTPTKGYHWPAGPYVEYEVNEGEVLPVAAEIEKIVNQIIESNPKISFYYEAESKHESGKPMRMMSVAGYPDYPCGGTHVIQAQDIGGVNIKKIKCSGNRVKVSYELS